METKIFHTVWTKNGGKVNSTPHNTQNKRIHIGQLT